VLNFKRVGVLDGWMGTTPVQVAWRWHIQRGHLVFPKPVTPPRMQESFERFDSELELVDIVRLSALGQGESGRIGASAMTL